MVTVYESKDKFGVIRAWACDDKAGCRVLKNLGEHPDWKFIFGHDVVVKKVSVTEYNKKAPSMDAMSLGQFNVLIHDKNKNASDEVLRNKLEKLASDNPELREKLVPILKKEAGEVPHVVWTKTIRVPIPGVKTSVQFIGVVEPHTPYENEWKAVIRLVVVKHILGKVISKSSPTDIGINDIFSEAFNSKREAIEFVEDLKSHF